MKLACLARTRPAGRLIERVPKALDGQGPK
jgi:hypothetical protein